MEKVDLEMQEMREANKKSMYKGLKPIPDELLDRVLAAGAEIKYDIKQCELTLVGGDPVINAEAMDIWKTKVW